MKKKIIIIFLLMVVVVCFFLFPQKINVQYDIKAVDSYNDLIDSSDVVVRGRFKKLDHEWNMRRDENDNPSDIYETIGKVFDFEISQVYKGDIDEHSSIKVNKRYSETIYYTKDGTGIDSSEITKDTPKIIALDPLYVEPDFNKEYILCLSYEKDYQLYYGSFEPYMIVVEGNELQLVSNLFNTNGEFKNTYKSGMKPVVITTHYNNTLKDFSKDLNLNEFEDIFK